MQRPRGPVVLNRGSLQAQGLKHFWVAQAGKFIDLVGASEETSRSSVWDGPCEVGGMASGATSGGYAFASGTPSGFVHAVVNGKIGTGSGEGYGGRKCFLATHSTAGDCGWSLWGNDDEVCLTMHSFVDLSQSVAMDESKILSLVVTHNGSTYQFVVDGVKYIVGNAGYSTTNLIGYTLLAACPGGTPTNSLIGGGELYDARLYSDPITDALAWHQYDPATRWDLYWQPSGRTLFWPESTGAAPATSPVHLKALNSILKANISTINKISLANIREFIGVN